MKSKTYTVPRFEAFLMMFTCVAIGVSLTLIFLLANGSLDPYPCDLPQMSVPAAPLQQAQPQSEYQRVFASPLQRNVLVVV